MTYHKNTAIEEKLMTPCERLHMFALSGKADGVFQELQAGGDPDAEFSNYGMTTRQIIWEEWDLAGPKTPEGTPMLRALAKYQAGDNAPENIIQEFIERELTLKALATAD